jgi:hypothetical protein
MRYPIPIADWRETWLAVTLAVHELEGVLMLIRRQLPWTKKAIEKVPFRLPSMSNVQK